MAWTGDVVRHITAAKREGLASILLFECGHEQRSNLSPEAAVRLRKTVCVACSRPFLDRIGQIRENVTLDQVLEKLRRANGLTGRPEP